jgi:GT2 family glycosyltransferase
MVSVIVPHYQDLAGLALCLEDLGLQTYPADRYEIIVADNNSPIGLDAVRATVAGRARVVIVDEKGAGPTRNGGAARANGDVFAFTDADCRPEPGWLRAGVAALGRYDFVGGRMRVLVEDRAHISPSEAFEKVFAFNNEAYVTRKGFTVTANLFCERRLFEKVGGFRTHVSEDMEWCHRAREAGYEIGFAGDAVVGHPARRTFALLKAKWRRVNRESFGIYKSRRFGGLAFTLRTLALPLSILAHAPKVLRSPELSGLDERWAAFVTLTRLRLWRLVDSLSIVAGDRLQRLKSAN